jgi:hypothetical protein
MFNTNQGADMKTEFTQQHIKIVHDDEADKPFVLYMRYVDAGEEHLARWAFAGRFASIIQANEAAYQDFSFTMEAQAEEFEPTGQAFA